jgi:hypothetical protein
MRLQVATTWCRDPHVTIPTAGNSRPEAVSTLIAFKDDEGRDRVVWSNELDSKFYFATHLTARTWNRLEAETGMDVPYPANGHINLAKTSSGQVFAAIKTSATGLGEPIIGLVHRKPAASFLFTRPRSKATTQVRSVVDEVAARAVTRWLRVYGERSNRRRGLLSLHRRPH